MVQNLLEVHCHLQKKIAGQFSTPKKLANLISRLKFKNKNKIVIDPCCGTGTINEVYKIKEYGLNQNQILDTTWASDKHSFPIQMSTMTMSNRITLVK